eukprot:2783050-Heterocapsa_arctica.AAC.1
MAAQVPQAVVVVDLQTGTSLGVSRNGWASSAGWLVFVEPQARTSVGVCKPGWTSSACWHGHEMNNWEVSGGPQICLGKAPHAVVFV